MPKGIMGALKLEMVNTGVGNEIRKRMSLIYFIQMIISDEVYTVTSIEAFDIKTTSDMSFVK